jgi:hypothetical protein
MRRYVLLLRSSTLARVSANLYSREYRRASVLRVVAFRSSLSFTALCCAYLLFLEVHSPLEELKDGPELPSTTQPAATAAAYAGNGEDADERQSHVSELLCMRLQNNQGPLIPVAFLAPFVGGLKAEY